MSSIDRFDKARKAFEELKQQPAIGAQLTETSNFEDAYYFLKNYTDRYLPLLTAHKPQQKWELENNLSSLLKRKELKMNLSEFDFVKIQVDSILAMMEEVLNETD